MYMPEKKEIKDKLLTVKVTEKQLEGIREMANNRGLSMSELVMWLVQRESENGALLKNLKKKNPEKFI